MTDAAPQQPDLTAARAEVMALVFGSAMSRQPPFAAADAPLRALPAELEAKLAARAAPATTAVAAGDARQHVWGRVVGPSAALAALDAVGIAVAAASGHGLLAVAAAVLFVPLAVLAGLGARFALRDPRRLTVADQRAIRAASQWHSSQDWTGPLQSCDERGLVIAAARAAERIARSSQWRSGRPDEQRLRLDLGAELDQLDEQAHRIAIARHVPGAQADAAVLGTAWEAMLNRAAALTAYAGRLDGLDRQRSVAPVGLDDPVRDSDLLAGSTRDDMAAAELLALTYYLNANLHEPPR